MFDDLSERLQSVFAGFSREKTLTEENMADALREIRRALLEADVSLRVAKAFLTRIKERAEGETVLKQVNASQQLVKIVHDEMILLLGKENVPLNFSGNPSLIVLFGLQGSGKTTSAGKLALHLRKKGKKPLLVAADVYRPAAIQQLITLGKQVGIPVHTIEGSNDVLEIARSGEDFAKQNGHDVVIIDTAGRLQVDTAMMAELLLLERSLQPVEKLLVIDAMTGQEAVNVAEAFNTQLQMTGLIITKMDGDARGGAALSVAEVTGQPIKFIGTGETIDGLEPFYPERLATRILGMGDVVSLVEKAQEAIDRDEAKRLEERMRKQTFSLEDFVQVQKQFKRLGSMGDILGMLGIPGLGKDQRELLSFEGDKMMKRVEVMTQSMTPHERQNPDILTPSRQKRVAKGCGMSEKEIQDFLKQFNQMKMVMKQFSKLTGKGGPESEKTGFSLHMPRSQKKNKEKNRANQLAKGLGLPANFDPSKFDSSKLPTGFPKLPPGLGGKFPFQ